MLRLHDATDFVELELKERLYNTLTSKCLNKFKARSGLKQTIRVCSFPGKCLEEVVCNHLRVNFTP